MHTVYFLQSRWIVRQSGGNSVSANTTQFLCDLPFYSKMTRDPRFDELSGTFSQEKFDKAYSFLDDIKANEKKVLIMYGFIFHVLEIIVRLFVTCFPPLKHVQFWSNTWNTWRVFYLISKHREVDWKNEAQTGFFYPNWGAWKSDKTIFGV